MYDQLKWTPIALERNRILRQYEPLQPYVFFILCEKFLPTMFLDIGANIGTYALFATRVGGIEAILAFEAAPRTFQQLRANISLNSLEKRIQPISGALTDSTGGTIDFMIVNDFSGANGVVETSIHNGDDANILSVAARRLDDIPQLSGCTGQRIAIKLDVEGHELPVLSGGKQLLETNEILLQVECYDVDTSYDGPDTTKLGQSLKEKGFRYLFHLGADQYWIKGSFSMTENEIRTVLEQGVEQMIHHSRTLGNNLQQDDVPRIRRQLLPGLFVEASGSLATWLRRLLRR